MFPDGVTHDTRRFTPFPLYVERSQGGRKWDVDGNELVDYVSGHGSLLLGHGRPEVVEAAKFYTGFYFDKSGALPSDVGEGWQGTAFGKGNFAMVYEGGWLIPYLNQQFPDLKYSAVLPPKGPKGYGNLVFTVAYVISRNAKNPEAAWKVIEFITNEASQTMVLESGFALPSRAALVDHPYFKDHPESATIFRGANGATPFMWGLYGSDVNEKMGQALERIYLKGQDPAESFQQAAQELRAIIGK